MNKLALLACVGLMAASVPALAANATHPYQNCDRKNDNCGPTGDAQTDQLNARQLGANPAAPTPMPGPGAGMNGAAAPSATTGQ